MRYVQVGRLRADGRINLGIDETTGLYYDFDGLIAAHEIKHLRPQTLQRCILHRGEVIRIKTCEVSGSGHYLDIAGEGAQDRDVSRYILASLPQPEFWYMTIDNARRSGIA